jgi:FtsP/CotA-like multicopper oxidase with cupredoxin domain
MRAIAIHGATAFLTIQRGTQLPMYASAWLIIFLFFVFYGPAPSAQAQALRTETCPRFPPGSVVSSPAEWRSEHGSLTVKLWFRSSRDAAGEMRYCYIDGKGNESPTLRVHPGDLVTLKLKNEAAPEGNAEAHRAHSHSTLADPCGMRSMTAASTNLHFHGLSIPPACHQDETLTTTIDPADAPFEYQFRIPANQPSGLYWYHPHIHGNSEAQVLGGASGALIVEGIEESSAMVAGMPERVLVIRDQNQAAVPSEANRPAKDLSVNFVPVPYPDFPMAVIQSRPGRRELWRVLNAGADTYLDLGVLVSGRWRSLGLVAVDGVPLGGGNGEKEPVRWMQEIPLPPGGRAEFIVETPELGVKAQLLTWGVDTSPPAEEDQLPPPTNGKAEVDDDANPPRQIAKIISSIDAPELKTLPSARGGARNVSNSVRELGELKPVRQRTLYFSEVIRDPRHPVSSTVYYVTEVGHEPKVFDQAAAPDITVQSGDVEDWVIENRSPESHAFHVHQFHFLLLERDGEPVNEGYLRDTVDVPYWDGAAKRYPSIKVRMAFRDPSIVGRVPYHCHVLQHADRGMMGTIEIKAKARGTAATAK